MIDHQEVENIIIKLFLRVLNLQQEMFMSTFLSISYKKKTEINSNKLYLINILTD